MRKKPGTTNQEVKGDKIDNEEKKGRKSRSVKLPKKKKMLMQIKNNNYAIQSNYTHLRHYIQINTHLIRNTKNLHTI